MKKYYLLIFALLFIACSNSKNEKSNYDYVNPFIGTGDQGHTFPGATVPHGMVQLSPDTDLGDWEHCSGYHNTDSTIIGFSHTHLSGTGIGDYGDILVMPTIGELKFERSDKENTEKGYRSRFDKSTEKAMPGFYSVNLTDYGINVQLTTTDRVGFHKYTFPKSDSANIIIDLVHGINWDRPEELILNFVGSNKISGLRKSSGWAKEQYVYFYGEFSKDFKDFGIKQNGELKHNLRSASGSKIKGYVSFETEENESVYLKLALSAVDIEGAKKNLYSEIKDWDFENVRSQAKEKWNKILNKIEVTGGSEKDKEKFYSGLYRSYVVPNLFMDVDGRYRGMDHKVHKSEDFTNYTVFSLWDTFRATKPLYTILSPEKTNDFVKSLLSKYKEGGELPIWELAGNYTGTMIGYHAIPVISDAIAKDIGDFDRELAFRAMKHSAMLDKRGLNYYKNIGYIPYRLENESVSKTLEYAFDDWCIAQAAKKLGKTDEYKYFMKRSKYYKNLFDPKTRFMRAKSIDGNWKEDFDPLFSKHRDDDYTEGNAWQYSWFVPQDPEGLIDLMGGKEAFKIKLDSLFTLESIVKGDEASPDISGLIGQYAQGNEPSHHIPYLYNFAGYPYKTQETVRKIMNDLYKAEPAGLSGNEDCGQMSSWFVLNAMGFYSFSPGSTGFQIGSPLFNEIKIDVGSGKSFTIKAINNSPKNIYIQSAKLNGKDYKSTDLDYFDLMKGGELIFKMGNKPNNKWFNENGN